MTETWFYHLDGWPVEKALPALVEKALERGWRAAIQATSAERIEALDLALWTHDDASFLAHGTRRDGDADLQPVYLTETDENPNGAAIRFFVERAEVVPALAMVADYKRAVVLFDGRDEDEIVDARRQWSALKAAGHPVSYWQQGEDGRWVKRA